MEIYSIPKKVKYQGKVYKVNANYRNTMEIYDWLENKELDEVDRAIMLVTKMFGVNAPVEQALVDEASVILTLGRKVQDELQKENTIDIFHDFETIRMDFIREYNVDIKDKDVSWEFFLNGIENLSENSQLSKLVEIRTVNLKDYKDQKQRKQIKELKERYALPKRNLDKEAELRHEEIKGLAELFM